MSEPKKILQAVFYKSQTRKEPVREWLLEFEKTDRITIGGDIATLEFSWPIGKPKCSPMKGVRGLYEVRSNISANRIARVIFLLHGSQMMLLHGFIKKTQKTPLKDLNLALKRMKEIRQNG